MVRRKECIHWVAHGIVYFAVKEYNEKLFKMDIYPYSYL